MKICLTNIIPFLAVAIPVVLAEDGVSRLIFPIECLQLKIMREQGGGWIKPDPVGQDECGFWHRVERGSADLGNAETQPNRNGCRVIVRAEPDYFYRRKGGRRDGG